MTIRIYFRITRRVKVEVTMKTVQFKDLDEWDSMAAMLLTWLLDRNLAVVLTAMT
jgi:acyl carrier protein